MAFPKQERKSTKTWTQRTRSATPRRRKHTMQSWVKSHHLSWLRCKSPLNVSIPKLPMRRQKNSLPSPVPTPHVTCVVGLGADCPRQVCGRRGFCDNEIYCPRQIDFKYKFLPWPLDWKQDLSINITIAIALAVIPKFVLSLILIHKLVSLFLFVIYLFGTSTVYWEIWNTSTVTKVIVPCAIDDWIARLILILT